MKPRLYQVTGKTFKIVQPQLGRVQIPIRNLRQLTMKTLGISMYIDHAIYLFLYAYQLVLQRSTVNDPDQDLL